MSLPRGSEVLLDIPAAGFDQCPQILPEPFADSGVHALDIARFTEAAIAFGIREVLLARETQCAMRRPSTASPQQHRQHQSSGWAQTRRLVVGGQYFVA